MLYEIIKNCQYVYVYIYVYAYILSKIIEENCCQRIVSFFSFFFCLQKFFFPNWTQRVSVVNATKAASAHVLKINGSAVNADLLRGKKKREARLSARCLVREEEQKREGKKIIPANGRLTTNR